MSNVASIRSASARRGVAIKLPSRTCLMLFALNCKSCRNETSPYLAGHWEEALWVRRVSRIK